MPAWPRGNRLELGILAPPNQWLPSPAVSGPQAVLHCTGATGHVWLLKFTSKRNSRRATPQSHVPRSQAGGGPHQERFPGAWGAKGPWEVPRAGDCAGMFEGAKLVEG